MSSEVNGCGARHDGSRHDGSRCPDDNRTLSAEASKLDGSEHRVGGGAKMTKDDDEDCMHVHNATMKAAATMLVLVLMLLLAVSSGFSGCRARHDGSRCCDGSRMHYGEAPKLEGGEHRVSGGAKMTKGEPKTARTCVMRR